MFRTLAQLGTVLADGRKAEELLLDPLPDSYTISLALRFDDRRMKFLGCEATELGPKDRAKLKYKKGPDNGFDPLPVTRHSGKAANVVRRMRRGLEDAAEAAKKKSAFACLLLRLVARFKKEEGPITSALEEKADAVKLSTKRRAVVRIRVGSASLENRPEWSSRLLTTLAERYGTKDDQPCILTDAPCGLCNRQRQLLYGNFNEIKVYNLDKPGTIAGGARIEAAARNFPVCPECAALANFAFRAVKQNLGFQMGGIDYLLLPVAGTDDSRRELYDVLTERRKSPDHSLADSTLANLTGQEREALDFVRERYGDRDTVHLHMVFYQAENALWRILGEVPEVLPSRIEEIRHAKLAAESPAFVGGQRITVPVLREFTKAAERLSPQPRTLLAWLAAIFGRGRLDRRAVLRVLVDGIVVAYRARDPKLARWRVLQAWVVLDFLRRLDVIDCPGGAALSTPTESPGRMAKFLAEHGSFLATPEQRIAFLTGCLTGDVAYVQRKHLKSEPFLKKVHGMRIDAARLKKLLSDAKLKLIQYDAGGLARETLELLSRAWMDSVPKWTCSLDETTFAFVLGLNLNGWVKGQKDEDTAPEPEGGNP